MNDNIKHPSHYVEGRKFEPKDVIRDWGLNFNLGNAVKYLARAGRKADLVEDLKKAQQYIQFEIDAIEAESKKATKPKQNTHSGDIMDAMAQLFSVAGKRGGKTDEEISKIIRNTVKDIVDGMAGVELEEIKNGEGCTEVYIKGKNVNPVEAMAYIEAELKDRLAMVL